MDIPSAKNAAKKAVETVIELIPEARYVALEGIELSDNESYWEVVVGYVREGDSPVTALSALGGTGARRTFKTLVLKRDTLELVKMEPYRGSDYA